VNVSNPLPTLALESYIRLHGNMTPEEITKLGYLGIYEPSLLTPEQKAYLDRNCLLIQIQIIAPDGFSLDCAGCCVASQNLHMLV
jgi:hypothetical protein